MEHDHWWDDLIGAVIMNEAHSATKYIGPKWINRATRRLYRGKIDRKAGLEILLTASRPNYRER